MFPLVYWMVSWGEARRLLRSILYILIAEYALDERELQDELQWILG